MTLVLLSSNSIEQNTAIDDAAAGCYAACRSFTFIPASSNGCEVYFELFKKYFSRFGCRKFVLLPADRAVTAVERKRGFASDAIFLSGGNTFHFLNSLRRAGFLPLLKAHAKAGRHLIGVSAGAIIMTPRITTAGIPSFDCDPNDIGLRSLTSLGVAPFEFSPHARFTPRYRREMIAHSKRSGLPLYCCGDGGGIVASDGAMTLVGPIEGFYAGQKFAEV